MIYVPSHSQCYRTVSLADIDDDDIDGHAAVLMELLALLAHLVMRPNDGSGWYVMPYDIMESILATIIRQGAEAFFDMTDVAGSVASTYPYIGELGGHVRFYGLYLGWERLAAHTLATIALKRGESDCSLK